LSNKNEIGVVTTRDYGYFPVLFDLDKEHLIKTWNEFIDKTKKIETEKYSKMMDKLNNSYMTTEYCE
jgi:hypothetical protein